MYNKLVINATCFRQLRSLRSDPRTENKYYILAQYVPMLRTLGEHAEADDFEKRYAL